ncbi:MAG: preprotein translocase subunit YajC [Bacteroidetes bacterium]|nr:preprotein translocase subunit YajC [Bacteroidota bacterium]
MIQLNIILQAAQSGGTGSFMIMMGGMLVVMYFFMIRPQQKKVKAQKMFNEGLKKGDKIITNGGLHGKVLQIDTTTVIIESEGTRLKIEKVAISSELSAPLNKIEEVKA